jgi:alpha-D-ribose 1-methylphosphonate 5-triphosphate synthase subunit PhnH
VSKEAQNKIRDLIIDMMTEGVSTGVLTEVEAMAACSSACAAIIATMMPPAHHAEALDITIEKLPKQVAFHTAEVAAHRKARSN